MFDTKIDTEEIAKALIALAHNNIDTIRKIKDSEGRIHLLQTSLIKRVEEDNDDKTMNIHLLNGDYFFS